MALVFMLAKRSGQWECLAHLLSWSFTQTGQKVKVIRADGEWITPQRVKDLQSDWGFEIKATNADTPQQNGYVEGVGGVLMDRAKTILIHAALPDQYVGDAIETGAHTYNLEYGRKGIRIVIFHNRPASLRYLRVFGCLCFVYDKKSKAHKPRPKAVPAVFLGYSTLRRSWKCLLKNTKVVDSRDVSFREDIRGRPWMLKHHNLVPSPISEDHPWFH